MPRVAQRTGWRARRDRGGVATIVAVLLAGGVLIGMTALVVDVGRFYMEREELQSGADATAYDVALDCIKNRPGCAATAMGETADRYADDNAKDAYGDIIQVCGRAPDAAGVPRLPECGAPPAGNLTDCIGTVPAGVKYVEVRTITEVADGTNVLPASFAGALVPGYQGTTVAACARVGWGPPASGLAFTFSQCEWDQYVPKDAAGNYILAPLGTTDPADEHAIVLHNPDGSSDTSCAVRPGFDLPGGFGWTDEDGGDCAVAIDSEGNYGADTGVPPSTTCVEEIEEAYKSGKPQLVPIYEWREGTGTNGVYTLKGVAGFVITGYNLPKLDPVVAKLHGTHLCTDPVFCVYGYFTEYIESGGEIGTGEDMGATRIKTIG